MGKQNHMKDHEVNSFRATFHNYGNNYLAMLPNPMSQEEMLPFFLDMIPEPIALAWKVLNAQEDYKLLRHNSSVSVVVDPNFQGQKLVLHMSDGEYIFPNIDVAYEMPLDHPLYSAVREFSEEYVRRWQQCRVVNQFVQNILHRCNTPGQVVRVWPEAVDFLNDRSKDILSSLERQARVPKRMDVNDPEWIARKKEVNYLVPLMMLAPEVDHLPDYEFSADVRYHA